MKAPWRTRQVLALAAATLASVAVLVSIALAYSQPISDPTLGSGWECHQIMFLMSCTRVEQPTPTAHDSRTGRICPRRV
ncbi:MAG: hypothetical protein JWP25_8928 [Bradyrhizobium sp.]|jgi:Na+/H+ antiporter NhaA|nr:hypothetical protein [Bradyrhizobium sp.]